ncbi:MAG TPA: HAD family hydrolase [Candidatus Eremiobacteraceae bacterium]|nr:HAD family hydrolase [Candidatus Eremiobacteraceae bacterium]
MPIRAIFFDLDDTLLDDTEASGHAAEIVARELAGDRGLDAADLSGAYLEAAIDFWETLEPGSRKPASGAIRPSIWRKALASRGVDDAALAQRMARRYDALRLERVELFPETLPVLHQLHGRYKLAIITNGFAETHEQKIARLELSRFFDTIVLAGELELVKPDPSVFHHAMQAAQATPQESIMVGDRYERDIVGAHAAGMRAIWVNVRNESLPAAGRPPEAVIATIAELPAALAAIDEGPG